MSLPLSNHQNFWLMPVELAWGTRSEKMASQVRHFDALRRFRATQLNNRTELTVLSSSAFLESFSEALLASVHSLE